MQTIGNYLKSGREARNIRLSEVAAIYENIEMVP